MKHKLLPSIWCQSARTTKSAVPIARVLQKASAPSPAWGESLSEQDLLPAAIHGTSILLLGWSHDEMGFFSIKHPFATQFNSSAS